MQEKTYEIIDMIDESNLRKRLEKIKSEIKKDVATSNLIKRFEDAKKEYEKYNTKEAFLNAKKEMLKNDLIKEYIELQNKVNILTIQINNRIKMITEGITNKK